MFKFVEHPENNEKLSDPKNKVKFKIMSLKVKDEVDYVPELVSSDEILNLLGPEENVKFKIVSLELIIPFFYFLKLV